MEETLILVDQNDKELGRLGRKDCHKGEGKLHRAFIVLILDSKNRMLIQLRNKNKLGGNRWDAAAVSHVRVGETYETAANRCMEYELGISTPVTKLSGFVYTERYDGFSENEYCSVLVGKSDGKVSPNKKEIDDIKYVNISDLVVDIRKNSTRYTEWFKRGIEIFLDSINK